MNIWYFMAGIGFERLVSVLYWLLNYFEYASYLFPTSWLTLGIVIFSLFCKVDKLKVIWLNSFNSEWSGV